MKNMHSNFGNLFNIDFILESNSSLTIRLIYFQMVLFIKQKTISMAKIILMIQLCKIFQMNFTSQKNLKRRIAFSAMVKKLE